MVAVYLSFFSFCILPHVRTGSAIPHSPRGTPSKVMQLSGSALGPGAISLSPARLSRTACDRRALYVYAPASSARGRAIDLCQPRDLVGVSKVPQCQQELIGGEGAPSQAFRACDSLCWAATSRCCCRVISDRLPELWQLSPPAHMSEH